jgi:outer membrane protein OmpA-like peptidoglycan-associated protein/tetratricopeptide (TPR) repeat protein
MKTTILFVVSALLFHVTGAQTTAHKKAQKYVHQFQYARAATEFEGILQANPSDRMAIEQLALCYMKLNNPGKAESYLSVVCNGENPTTEHIKYYAQALAANGKYDASRKWYETYYTKTQDVRINDIVASYGTMTKFYEDSSFYTLQLLGLNSSHSDFSPAFFKNGIVFCSARGSQDKAMFAWNNSFYIDLFSVEDIHSEPHNFGKPVNTPLHEGPATFSRAFDTIYFTRNNYINNKKSNSKEGVVKLKIYYSVLRNGVWQKEQNLPLNHDDYSIGHPALSSSGKLYFVSDMPGGFGGTDIYYTTQRNGRWIEAVNLGPDINTSGNEMFPFINTNGDLYFASTGHPGLGGLDIFYAPGLNDKISHPKNLGYPINSAKDDFGLIIKDNKGFLTSNRGADPKDDNIYAFTIDKTKTLIIRAVTAQNVKLTNYELQLTAIKGEQIRKNIETLFANTFDSEDSYKIRCVKTGYIDEEVTLTKKDFLNLRANDTLDIHLKEAIRKVRVCLQSVLGEKMPGGKMSIKNLTTGEVQVLTLDKNGYSSIDLKPGSYELTGSKAKYRSNTVKVNPASLPDNPLVTVALTSADALFDKNEVGQTIELEIRYDVNKATIRPEAEKKLNTLVDFLSKNPGVKVEIGSHTDTRGTDEANNNLSERRAESAVVYLVRKGISRDRLIPIGYGESDLKIRDAKTEGDHQQNRRTTVKIVSIKN